MLRNKGNVLPLAPHGEVAVFGRVQCDWFAVGYGSGGDVKAPYEVSLLDALREAGVLVSGEVAEVYEAWSAANPPDQGYWGNWPRHFEEMPLDPGLVSRAANTAGTAVVVLGRAAGRIARTSWRRAPTTSQTPNGPCWTPSSRGSSGWWRSSTPAT
nr:hypothetical protein [Tessaracoccus coleopterorum]